MMLLVLICEFFCFLLIFLFISDNLSVFIKCVDNKVEWLCRPSEFFFTGLSGILSSSLFTLGSSYSTNTSGAEQMPETNNSY